MSKIKNLCKTLYAKATMSSKTDPKVWVFSSVDNRYYNYNSKYLFEYVRENYNDITPLFVINEDTLRKELQHKYGSQYFIETNTLSGIRTVLRAGVWFTSAGLPVYGRNLKKHRLIINLWHGVPLKKITLMENGASVFYKWYFKFIFSENYSSILTTSSQLIAIMKESFAVKEEIIKVLGQPRNDVIFLQQDQQQLFRKYYSQLAPFKKVMLYAPTYRENGGTWLFPFEDFTIEQLEDYLEEKHMLLLIRTHISEQGNSKIKETNRIKFINSDLLDDVTEILGSIDVLITDYSSVYIDFLLTQKPIIFLPYDREDYFKTRGFNFEYDEVTPGPKPTTYEAFTKEVTKLLEDKEYYKLPRESMNLFFNEVTKPCSEMICEEVRKQCKI